MTPIERVFNLVGAIVGRFVLTGSDDSGRIQKLQVNAGADENYDDVPRFANYGFYSRPKKGDGIYVAFGGDLANMVAIALEDTDARLRDLLPGECAIADDLGKFIRLHRDGRIEAVAGAATLELSDTRVRFELGAGSIEIDSAGNVAIDGPTVTIRGTDWDGHTHSNVEPGSGNTGGVV